MILLIGSGDDPHLIAIRNHIIEQNGNAAILATNREALLQSTFSYFSNSKRFCMSNADLPDLSSVKAAFFLSPFYMRRGFSSTQEKEFWHFTWRESLYGYYAYLAQTAFVVNQNLHNALAAQNKIALVDCAGIADLAVPDCLISNNREQIMNFFDRHYEEVVLKTMHQIYLEYQNESTMLLVKKSKNRILLSLMVEANALFFYNKR